MTSARDRIFARHLVETALLLEQAAASMAGEQSAGTFISVEDEADELIARHGARGEGVREFTPAAAPSLPSARRAPSGAPIRRGEVASAFSVAQAGPVFGNAGTRRLAGVQAPPPCPAGAFPAESFGQSDFQAPFS